MNKFIIRYRHNKNAHDYDNLICTNLTLSQIYARIKEGMNKFVVTGKGDVEIIGDPVTRLYIGKDTQIRVIPQR